MNNDYEEGFLNIHMTLYKTRISSKFLNRRKYHPSNPGIVRSYIPGTVLEIFVTPGSEVKKGEDLITLDAMKMKNRIKSIVDGKVKSVLVTAGSKVAKGNPLLELE